MSPSEGAKVSGDITGRNEHTVESVVGLERCRREERVETDGERKVDAR